jgi:hypothetical protein
MLLFKFVALLFKFFKVIFLALIATDPLAFVGEIVYAGTLEFLGLLILFCYPTAS